VQAADVLDACEGLMAAFEIVDRRVRDWRIRLEDTVADNASSGSFVLGSRMLGPDEIDLETVRMELAKNGDVIASATGSAVMGHPARAVAWLANKLTELGSRIEPGDIILSGSLTKAWDVLTGDVFCASFGPLGKVHGLVHLSSEGGRFLCCVKERKPRLLLLFSWVASACKRDRMSRARGCSRVFARITRGTPKPDGVTGSVSWRFLSRKINFKSSPF
jgi:hypothetical protein